MRNPGRRRDELSRRFEKWAIVPNTSDLIVRSGGSRMGSIGWLSGRNSASAPSACNTVASACPASLWRPEITTRLPPFAKADAGQGASDSDNEGAHLVAPPTRLIRPLGEDLVRFPSRHLKILCRVADIPHRHRFAIDRSRGLTSVTHKTSSRTSADHLATRL